MRPYQQDLLPSKLDTLGISSAFVVQFPFLPPNWCWVIVKHLFVVSDPYRAHFDTVLVLVSFVPLSRETPSQWTQNLFNTSAIVKFQAFFCSTICKSGFPNGTGWRALVYYNYLCLLTVLRLSTKFLHILLVYYENGMLRFPGVTTFRCRPIQCSLYSPSNPANCFS